MEKEKQGNLQNNRIPVVKAQDVEFSMDEADKDDLEAIERAEAASKRQDEL